MNREEVELLLKSTRPVPAPIRAPRLRAGAPRLQIALAAAFLLAVVGVIILPPSDARPQPGERRWQLPVEISRNAEDLNLAVVGSQELVRTPSGAAVYITDFRMWVSRDGKAPWTKIELGGWHPSAPLVEGNTVSFLITSPWSYVTVDIPRAEIVSKVRLPRGFVSKQWTTYLAASGADRYAVLCGLGGPIQFFRSDDGGKTWPEPREIGRTGDNQMIHHNPAFLSVPGALWMFFVDESRRIQCRRSVDRGETWTAHEGPGVPTASGAPSILRAAAIGKTVHLVCQTDQRHVLHFSSADDGRAWSPGTLLLIEASDGFGPDSRTILGAAGGRLLVSGIYGKAPRLSDDGGRTWTELDAFEGIRGTPTLTPACLGENGSVSFAPQVNLDNRVFFLFREWIEEPRVSALDAAGRRAAESSIAHLSDDDIQARDQALRGLVALGAPALPTLRQAAARAEDPERKARLREAIRRIELAWPDAQVPPWWKGAAER